MLFFGRKSFRYTDIQTPPAVADAIARAVTRPIQRAVAPISFETLEGRQLLHGHGGDFLGGPGAGFGHEASLSAITFAQAPAAVQTALSTLATSDGLGTIATDESVKLGNLNGVSVYTVTLEGTGSVTKLTVDENGVAVTAPVKTTTTFGDLGTANATAAAKISEIVTALSLTAPTSTTSVTVLTSSTGEVTYSVALKSSTATSKRARSTTITVDGNGNAVGNQTLPFSVLSGDVQDGINTNLPTGASTLASTSTQSVKVQTIDGVVLYSATFTSTGTKTTVTVNSAGVLTSLPSSSTTTFGAIAAAAQAEIQALATANGVTTTIDSATSVTAHTQANGEVLYSVTLEVTTTDDDGDTHTQPLTITVDSAGNPTTTALGFGRAGFVGGAFCNTPITGTADSSSSSGSSSSSSSSTATASIHTLSTSSSSGSTASRRARR